MNGIWRLWPPNVVKSTAKRIFSIPVTISGWQFWSWNWLKCRGDGSIWDRICVNMALPLVLDPHPIRMKYGGCNHIYTNIYSCKCVCNLRTSFEWREGQTLMVRPCLRRCDLGVCVCESLQLRQMTVIATEITENWDVCSTSHSGYYKNQSATLLACVRKTIV